MGDSFNEIWFEEALDETKKNVLFVKYVFTPDGRDIEKFVVIYWIVEGGEKKEIVRFDCSEKERLNVHTFYTNPPEKRYLNPEKSFEVLMKIVDSIRKNWRSYLIKYLEK